jgi:hypothetical protein
MGLTAAETAEFFHHVENPDSDKIAQDVVGRMAMGNAIGSAWCAAAACGN